MNERTIMEPDKVYRPKYPVQYATLWKLLNLCKEKDMRFGEALTLCTDDMLGELSSIEDFELDKKIQEFVKQKKYETDSTKPE
jgi:hypothetical protein